MTIKFMSVSKSADLVERARKFAVHAHGEQKRRYTGEPYVVHTQAVAGMVEGLPRYTEVRNQSGSTYFRIGAEVVAAAHLHDVLEDTSVTAEELETEFGERIALLVRALTNAPLSVGNRATRKAIDIKRLAAAPDEAQTIKVADLIDNTSSIVQHDPKFAPTFLDEKEAMLLALARADESLWQQAWVTLRRGRLALKLNRTG